MFPLPFPVFAPCVRPVWNNLAPLLPPRPKSPAKPAAEEMENPTSPPSGHDTVRHNHAEYDPERPPFFPKPKTVYINTYSQSMIRRSKTERDRVVGSRTGKMKPLLTVEAMKWRPPSQEVCERFSGISDGVQDFVKGIKEARGAINFAINQTLNHLSRGHDMALIEICCVAGTHRSVAAAEIIGVELARKGIDTYVRHLHRKKMPGDEW